MSESFEPLLLDWPEAMETPRLRLVVPRASDGARVFQSVRCSMDELHTWMPWARRDYGERDSEIWCRRVRGEFHLRLQLQFMMLDRHSEMHLGNVGAFRFNWEVRSAEIGYWLRTDHTGRGLMTEAVTALRDWLAGEQNLRRVEIRCDDRNAPSARVAERAGFLLEGVHRRTALAADEKPRDTRVYGFVPNP